MRRSLSGISAAAPRSPRGSHRGRSGGDHQEPGAPGIRSADHVSLTEASEIAAFCHALGARIVQLHGDIDRDELKRLKTLDPNLTVIKSLVIGMRDDKALEANAE